MISNDDLKKKMKMSYYILDPVQTSANNMEFGYLNKEFGDKISFHGGIDVQIVLPKLCASQVRDEVNRAINILGENGGYIVAPTHIIQSDTPIENIIAMYETVLRT